MRLRQIHPSAATGALLCVLAQDPCAAQVSGIILDQATGLPLAGALVSVQATSTRTTSAVDGSFVFPGVTGSSLVIVGAKEGFFSGSTTVTTPAAGATVQLTPVAPSDDSTYVLAEPQTCGACHPDQLAQWTDSPMSRAGTNVWTYDLYDGTGTTGGMGGWVYARDSAVAGVNPNSECAACHQPQPWIDRPFSPLEPIDSLSVGAMHGVSCDVCHKIAHIDETKTNYPGIYPGVVTLTRPQGPAYNQVQYGVLGDATFSRLNRMRPSYQPQLTAAVCAACHQDKNDHDQDGDFEESAGVVSEPTYQEWLESPYGDVNSPLYRTCVDCHMPAYGATTVCNSLTPPLARDPQTIRSHRIEGTTPGYLENAASLALNCSVTGTSLAVQATLVNDQTGHSLPTGVTIRNMILLVEAWREEDGYVLNSTGSQLVHDLGGAGDPSLGYFAGQPGKLYTKLNHDSTGQGPVFFTEATGILWDNRIPALASDVTNYSFDIPPDGGALHVRARLIYRRSFRAFIDAKGWTTDGHGNPLEDLQAPHFGHLMEQADWLGQVASAPESPGTDPLRTALEVLTNPAQSTVRIQFALTQSGSVHLAVFDVAGRQVSELVAGERQSGYHRVEWPGRDNSGRAAAPGIYWCRLESPGGEVDVRRFVLLR